MLIVPQIEQKDHLHNIIGLAQLYFTNVYVRWWSKYCFVASIVYFSCLLHSLFYNSTIITEQDLFYTAMVLEVIFSKITLDYGQSKLTTLNAIRWKYFWSNDFLTAKEKRMFTKKINFFVVLIHILWLLACVVTIMTFIVPFRFPKHVHREEWPYFVRKIAEILFFILFTGGVYIGISNLCYCVYIILQSYFQMIIVKAYITKAIRKYKKIPNDDKIFEKKYQSEIRLIIKRIIYQYQKLKWYGIELGLLCSRVSPLHFIAGVLSIGIGLHSLFFIQTPSQKCVLMGIIHLVYSAICYVSAGQLFAETYENLRTELEKMDWYTFDNDNQKLYYMFLMYTQKEQAVKILPSVYVTRPVLTQFSKGIYTLITLMRSVNK